MRKRAMLPLLALMIPSLASAATYWQITATTSPTALKTNLTAARPANFGNYTTPGGASMSLTKVTRTPYNTVNFDVAAVPGKAVIVKVDGVQVGTLPGTYSVNKGTLLNHNIVAYYNTAAASFTLTTQPAAGGTITQTATYLTNGIVTVTPSSGYLVSGLIIGSTPYALADALPAGVTMTGDASGATYTFASGSYTVKGVFAAAPAAKAVISTPGMTVATGATGIAIDGSTSTSNVSGTTYSWTTTCGTVVPTADPTKATYTAPATVGSCTVTLTVNAGSLSPTATVNIATQAPSTQICLECHNGTDGPVVPGNFTTNVHNGQASCIDCHNADNTVSHPFNTATAMSNSCASCHTPKEASVHGLASGHTTGTCQRCHASEGAIVGANVGWTGSYANVLLPYTSTVWRNNKPAASTAGISCAVCHDPHTGLRAINTIVAGSVVPWDPNQNTQSNDQYDVCTSCHTLTDNTGAVVGNYHDGGSINATRTISDSHFDNSATPAATAGTTLGLVEGYVIRNSSANPCADCHNLHGSDLSVQEAWAKSAHAGKIATKKEEAACTQSVIWYNAAYPTDSTPPTACTDSEKIGTSTRTVLEHFQRTADGIAFYKTVGAKDDAAGNAWTHYSWDDTAGRGSCQRCHTATGIMNFLNSPGTYDATGAGNNFSHLSGWTSTNKTSPQNELLYCWGCHSDSQTGVLRNPGAITEVYSGTPTVTVSYPDLGKSNVCMACHLGRETGEVVKASTLDFTNLSFINSHYLAAGATIFNESGYEYDGQNYDGGYHKNVGVANAYNTGTNGPCVACHMTSAEGHAFEVVTKDATDSITAVTSTQCANCHGGLTPAALNTSKHEFHLAMEELKTALGAKGIVFYAAHPYFYKDLNANGVYDAATESGSGNAFKNWDAVYPGKGKDVMGAAFNYNLFEHDPGAYAHNRQYALKLIKDSIDFLADGAVNGLGVSTVVTSAINSQEFSKTTTWAASSHPGQDCSSCHQGFSSNFAKSLHGTRPGKGTFYNDGLGETDPAPLQRGFGNFVNVPYANLPCADCHNAAATTDPNTGLDTWTVASCADCHSSSNPAQPIAADKCYGCHSRQAYEGNPGAFNLTDVHLNGGQMNGQPFTCTTCHGLTDMHGDGTEKASMLDTGAITANCQNCHDQVNQTIPEHQQHFADVDCSTCHMQSVVTCYNCHFDNEGITDGTVTHQKFASAKFGGPGAKSWRFLVNRVMPDGTTKIYPGSMQSLMADQTALDGLDDGQGTTFLSIAPYYSHSITRTDALRCASCHGTATAQAIAAGTPVDVVKWKAAEGVVVPLSSLGANWQAPTGVIPVPEDTSLLLFDFVDLTEPAADWDPTKMNVLSSRVAFKRGADNIHMPDAYVKPLTASQLLKLATPR